MTSVLWIIQGLLAVIFLFTGGMKLVQPLEELTKQMPLPGLFVRFIGVAEVLGATVFTLVSGEVALALIPLIVGLLAVFVAYGRWRLAPHPGPTNVRYPASRSPATGA